MQVGYLAEKYPFWRRSGGADHAFFFYTDRGGSHAVTEVLKNMIQIVHFGFADEQLMGSRTVVAAENRSPRSDPRSGFAEQGLGEWGGAGEGVARADERILQYGFSHRWGAFWDHRDVVVPPDIGAESWALDTFGDATCGGGTGAGAGGDGGDDVGGDSGSGSGGGGGCRGNSQGNTLGDCGGVIGGQANRTTLFFFSGGIIRDEYSTNGNRVRVRTYIANEASASANSERLHGPTPPHASCSTLLLCFDYSARFGALF